MEGRLTFRALLEKIQNHGDLKSQDFQSFVIPLLEEVVQTHAQNKVLFINSDEKVFTERSELKTAEPPISPKLWNKPLFRKVSAATPIQVSEHFKSTVDTAEGMVKYENLSISKEFTDAINKPVYFVGYRSWEETCNHFDPVTEIFSLGMLFSSLAFGLDFNDADDLEQFVSNRNRLYYLNRSLHPSLQEVIYDMTHLYREDRVQDAHEILVRVKNYRDVNPENHVDLTKTEGFKSVDVSERGNWILNRLKNRLYDMSRRNNLLYFKDKDKFINLTVGSIPHLLDHTNIKEKDLLLWNTTLKENLKKKKKIELNSFLQFDTNKYLAPRINKVRLEARKSSNEFGFSPLRTVVAFINWYNFKENPDERITSPLLLLKTELIKKKGVKDRFSLEYEDLVAELNPVLVQHFKDSFGIVLPDYVDLETSSVLDLVESLQSQVEAGGAGVKISWKRQPKIKLLHSIAKRNFNLKRRKTQRRARGLNLRSLDYSYEKGKFQPLGLEIFKKQVLHKNQALEYIINEDLAPNANYALAEKETTFYSADEEGDSNPFNWEVDTTNMTLGNFNYRKMSLVKDYNHIIESNIKDEVFGHLFSELPAKKGEEIAVRDISKEFPIVASDPTQNLAVNKARTGKSYVIQGPPGTGKSQTITNLIADYVSRGKKVLFVCEKRAALDVVYHRLKNKGLDELSILVHDSRSDKKEFIKNLKGTYEKFTKQASSLKKATQNRAKTVSELKEQLAILENYHELMGKGAVPNYELIKSILTHQNGVTPLTEKQYAVFPEYKEWLTHKAWLSEWLIALKERSLATVLSDFSLVQINPKLVDSDHLKLELNELTTGVEEVLDLLTEEAEMEEDIAISEFTLEDLLRRSELANLLAPILKNGKLDLFIAHTKTGTLFSAELEKIKELQGKVTEQKGKNQHWKSELSVEDSQNLIDNWHEKNASFFKFLSPSFYKLKKQIGELYNFSAHQVKPSIHKVIERLEALVRSNVNLLTHIKHLQAEYGITDVGEKLDWLVENRKSPNTLLKSWLEKGREQEIAFYATATPSINLLKERVNQLYRPNSSRSLFELNQINSKVGADLSHLAVMKTYLEKLSDVSPELTELILGQKWELTDFEFHCAYHEFSVQLETVPHFKHIEAGTIESAVHSIGKLLDEYFASNVDFIKAEAEHKFQNQIRITESPANQLTDEEKLQKKSLKSARRILENEFGKSMRYKSVRELFNNEARNIMTTIKPVWLMSPLSVSDIMPIDTSTFDVVIFDEASQITLEEGVPALFRTNQIIVVGDEMQMPPTNFFGSGSSAEEDEEIDEDIIGFSLDADSLLNQSSRKLSSVMLGWHYRSRRESLIGFSNAAFYERSLLTIPDAKNHMKPAVENEPIKSIEEAINVSEHLNKSISYHYLENGIYDKRKNANEAKYIARLVREIISKKEELSIGIVAFSMEQQGEIEAALEELAVEDSAFDTKLEEEYQKVEDDQFNGLFVKNLENVQGDERDVIIMSICYAHNTTGKMYMNFGPINRRGGEKRLNVIFSRAKKNMMVVSSILPQHITNDYNEGANYFKKFLSYAKHISDGNIKLADGILDTLNKADEATDVKQTHALISQLEEKLMAKGYTVSTQVGQSNFKCDLVVNDPLKPEESLAILIDHKTHYENSDVLEQYVLKPAVLRGFGWRVINVFSKDWLLNSKAVLVEIELALKTGNRVSKPAAASVAQEGVVNAKEQVTAEPKVQEPEQLKEKHKIEPEAVPSGVKRLEFIEGNSSKFWQVKTAGVQVIIEFGRIGNKPQTRTKEYADETLAAAEMKKMIQKKTAKGYVEV